MCRARASVARDLLVLDVISSMASAGSIPRAATYRFALLSQLHASIFMCHALRAEAPLVAERPFFKGVGSGWSGRNDENWERCSRWFQNHKHRQPPLRRPAAALSAALLYLLCSTPCSGTIVPVLRHPTPLVCTCQPVRRCCCVAADASPNR